MLRRLALPSLLVLFLLVAPPASLASSPSQDRLPGPGDFSISIPPGWERGPDFGMTNGWRPLALYSQQTGPGTFANLNVIARLGDESYLTEGSMRADLYSTL